MTSWALLIGINRYQFFSGSHQLFGCVNDVNLIKDVLIKKFSFPSQNICCLLNEQASQEAILFQMAKLINQVKENDTVVFHFSGHGSQMTDREGDEPDGLDETIVPYDSGRKNHPNKDITDDEIYLWLIKLTERTRNITLIFDCCHSGTITRQSVVIVGTRQIEPDLRPISELPPSPVEGESLFALTRNVGLMGKSGWLPVNDRYLLLAACRDEEKAFEFTNNIACYGALTYFLCQELNTSTSGTTYQDIFERVSMLITKAFPKQHPQMEGSWDRELFGHRNIEPMRFVPITERQANQVILGAGLAHGLTLESEWAIYSQSVKSVADQTKNLGLIKITELDALSAKAQIVTEQQPNTIATNSRAVELVHYYEDLKLSVWISKPKTHHHYFSELVNLTKYSNLFTITNDSQQANAKIYLVTPEDIFFKQYYSHLNVETEVVWLVVAPDGHLLMNPQQADEDNSLTLLIDNLEKLAQYHRVISLKNCNPNNPLKHKLDFILLRQNNEGVWETAAPEKNSGFIVFQEGERIACQIINHYCEPIYISILDLGLTGAISLLYPVRGASEMLKPDIPFNVGTRLGETLKLFVPELCSKLAKINQINNGLEVFKLFATTRPSDFSLLIQTSLRKEELSTKDFITPLENLIQMTLTGIGKRNLPLQEQPSNTDWITIERPFLVTFATN